MFDKTNILPNFQTFILLQYVKYNIHTSIILFNDIIFTLVGTLLEVYLVVRTVDTISRKEFVVLHISLLL